MEANKNRDLRTIEAQNRLGFFFFTGTTNPRLNLPPK